MALLDLKDKKLLNILNLALKSELKIAISYISADKEIEATYEFVETKFENKKIVRCISCSCWKEDPLKLFGSVKTMEGFNSYIESFIIGYEIKEIKLYPKDWISCFEDENANKLEIMKKKIPELIKNAKTQSVNTEALHVEDDNDIEDKRTKDRKIMASLLKKLNKL